MQDHTSVTWQVLYLPPKAVHEDVGPHNSWFEGGPLSSSCLALLMDSQTFFLGLSTQPSTRHVPLSCYTFIYGPNTHPLPFEGNPVPQLTDQAIAYSCIDNVQFSGQYALMMLRQQGV